MLKRNACWHPRELSPRQGLGVWKATRSVWHWLFCANSTLGDALASFAANPGKEITDTHNAVFCLSAKKKTNPLSLYKRRYRHSHSLSPCPRSKPRLSFISRNMPSNICACAQWLARSKPPNDWKTVQPLFLSAAPWYCCTLLWLASFK